jgi:vanillate O-demethylase ferredoxin subunit
MNGPRRKSLLWLHTWSGLTIGLVIVFLAITGAGFALRPQLDAVVNRDLLVVPTCTERLPLDTLAHKARTVHPAGKLYRIEVTSDANASAAIQFTDKDYVYVNPCSGGILGTQNEYGGFFGTFDWLHRFRFVEPSTGRKVAGWAAAVFATLLIVAGIVLWWPRSKSAIRSAFKFNSHLPGSARTLSLHRIIGLYTSVILLMIALTGIPIAFVPVKEMIYREWGYAQPVPPISALPNGAKPLPMERFWQNSKAAVPQLEWVALRYPAKPRDAVEAEIRERNVPHVNAKSYLYMDAYTGSTLKLRHYSDIGLGRKIYLYILALHAGLVGGLPYEMLLLVAALAVPVQAYSGFSPYLRRKFRASVKTRLSLRLVRKTIEATDTCSFEFADPQGKTLPPFSAGSHIDVHVSDAMVRQYSLCNDPKENHRYVIGVLRRSDSRGGSRSLHDDIHVGDIVEASVPKNRFPLARAAKRSLLIAGGIGVTPILCMAETLAGLGADFEMHYCARSPDRTAFKDRIERSAFADRVTFHIGGGHGRRLNIAALLQAFDHDTHIYVCGPGGLMEAVIAGARQQGWPDAHVHREYFAAEAHDSTHDVAFDVRIASTGRVIRVAEGKTVVAALAESGVDIPTSCAQGVCGTCLTRVLDGEVEHHDMFLTPAERARNDQFTPCCSRARSATLVLDL